MNKAGRHGGAGSSSLSKDEAKLRKKGVANMSIDELNNWLLICERNEHNSPYSKSRKSWKEAKEKAELLIGKLST